MTRHTESSDEKLLWTPENTQERNFWAEAVSNMDALDDEPETEAEDECVKSSASVIVSIVPPVAVPLISSSNFSAQTDPYSNNPARVNNLVGEITTTREGTQSPLREPAHLSLDQTSSDDALWRNYPSDGVNGSTDDERQDEADVEALIREHEDEEEDEPLLTQESFDFSDSHSRHTSMTSVSSGVNAIASSNSRKRTLDEVDPPSPRSYPATPVKARRTSEHDHAKYFNRSISHDTGLATTRPSDRSTIAGSSTTPLKGKPHAPCGWEGCDSTHITPHAAALETAGEDETQPTPQDVFIIAHDARVQALFDKYDIAYGVQFQVARGVISGTWLWKDVTKAKVKQFRGSNENIAEKVRYIIKGEELPQVLLHGALPVWKELDREEAALRQNRHRGLGLQGSWMGEERWYGGRIQQVLALDLPPVAADDATTEPSLNLCKMKMTRSHRFGRYVGSRRIMQFKLPKNSGSRLRKFLEKKFVLLGRTFKPFKVKDGSAYLLEVDEDYERVVSVPGDEYRLSYDAFIAWHNPTSFNQNQPVAKWATRFDLGLSNSIPVLRFEPDNIHNISDVYAEHDPTKPPPTEKILTDGCGYINASALNLIHDHLDIPLIPTAVQGRIYGSKGMWVKHPEHTSLEEPPMIWIRPSQIKIKYGLPKDTAITGLSPAHYSLDLVSYARVTSPAHFSKLLIHNLYHNGVPLDALAELMKKSLELELVPLMDWDGDEAMQRLWDTVDRVGNIHSMSAHDDAKGMERALGFGRRVGKTLDVVQDVEDDTISKRYFPGGKPIFGGELCMQMLQAGFKPQDELFLYDELRKVMRNKADRDIKRFHVAIVNSFEAPFVADPFGQLQEDEIAFTSSTRIFGTDQDRFTLRGDVLMFRNPARLASDVRKVKAVTSPMYADYPDVIILPTNSRISLASILSGGDLDGDTGVVIFEHSIAERFSNGPIVEPTPNLVETDFQPANTIQRVDSVHASLSRSSPPHARLMLQKCLLSGLTDSRVGLCSRFFDLAVYMYGYNDPRTRRLGEIVNIELDSPKSGYRLKQDVFDRQSRTYRYQLPESLNEGVALSSSDEPPRPRSLGPFVLDDLLKKGRQVVTQLLIRYERHKKPEDVRHVHLLKPYALATEHLLSLAPEFRAVEKHVKACHATWCELNDIIKGIEERTKRNTREKVTRIDMISLRCEKTRQLAEQFVRGPDEEETHSLRALGNLNIIMASYAYSLRPTFAFNVGFQALCDIQAKRDQQAVIFTRSFAQRMAMSSTARRLLARRVTDEGSGEE